MHCILLLLLFAVNILGAPPGTIVDHSPASSGLYIGSPSIVLLPNGDYLAAHDFFGPQSAEFEAPTTALFRSADRGLTWQKAGTLKSQFWSGLFVHRGVLYIMGTDRHHGRIVIRRSTDHGATWTQPTDSTHGLLTTRADYHTAPTPVIQHAGRIWRAFEDASGGSKWGMRYLAMMLSAPEDGDLLNASTWTFSEPRTRDQNWLDGQFNAWLEGNAVPGPDEQVLNILRIDLPGFPEKAAILHVSKGGGSQQFDPLGDIVDFPGGAKKFTIRFDPLTRSYWSLANVVPPEFRTAAKPASIRNTLALVRSRDLRAWENRAVLLQHPDSKNHAFQYPDWQFDGDDIVAVVRTAFDDAEGGAHNAHDANYLTFHRIPNFRSAK